MFFLRELSWGPLNRLKIISWCPLRFSIIGKPILRTFTYSPFGSPHPGCTILTQELHSQTLGIVFHPLLLSGSGCSSLVVFSSRSGGTALGFQPPATIGTNTKSKFSKYKLNFSSCHIRSFALPFFLVGQGMVGTEATMRLNLALRSSTPNLSGARADLWVVVCQFD